jgi:hypothetical protein
MWQNCLFTASSNTILWFTDQYKSIFKIFDMLKSSYISLRFQVSVDTEMVLTMTICENKS